MTEPRIVGTQPWLPGLSRRPAWTEPVSARRLAALRIGVAAVLLVDVLGTYLPRVDDFFGPQSLGAPGTFIPTSPTLPAWSLFAGVRDPRVFHGAIAVWAVAAFFLLVGWHARLAAAAAWVLSVSLVHLNPYVHNTGDTVRTIILFYLMLSPCSATWSVDALRRRHPADVRVPPWPVRMLFLQLVAVYFFNGLYKLSGPFWPAGESLSYVLKDLSIARWSYAQLPVPEFVLRLLTWAVLAWEVGFPLLVWQRRTRTAALVVGVLFHLGIGVTMEVGLFSPYMLCLYLPVVSWEAWGTSRRHATADHTEGVHDVAGAGVNA